jgi:hypothetical protein
MFKLASLLDDKAQAAIYKERAERIITRLTEACFETSSDAQGLLRDSTYNYNSNSAVEQFMPFGDYYYLEGLVLMSDKPLDLWGTASLTQGGK